MSLKNEENATGSDLDSALRPRRTTESMELPKTFDKEDVKALIDQAAEVPVSLSEVPVVGRRKLASDLFFSKFDKDVVVDLLLAVINYYSRYEKENEKLRMWRSKGYASLLEYIVVSFFTILMPLSYTKTKKKVKESRKDKQQDPNTKIPKLKVTNEDITQILQVLVSMDVKSDLWNILSFVYALHQNPELLVGIVLQAASQGTASYGVLQFMMKKPRFHSLLQDPCILFFTALLGPLSAPVVERFAAERSPEFREDCRRLLLKLELCTRSRDEWEAAVDQYYVRSNGQRRIKPLEYSQFCHSMVSLMNDLRRKFPHEDRIHEGYAFVKVKNCAENFYVNKTWKAEHLHEAIYTILHQRPAMKKYIVDLLEKKFEDKETAMLWKTADLKSRQRHDVLPFTNTTIPFHESNAPFLSIPKAVQSIAFVNNTKKLKRLSAVLEKYSYEDRPVIGLDAEWSSYVFYSKATILQIAFPTEIFILDLEAFPQKPLSDFLLNLFSLKNVLKIGFQFNEDLGQLRRSVPKCQGLYYPKNLICIGSLVRLLLQESSKRPEVSLEGIIHPISSKATDENNPSDLEGYAQTLEGDAAGTEYVELEIVETRKSEPVCLPDDSRLALNVGGDENDGTGCLLGDLEKSSVEGEKTGINTENKKEASDDPVETKKKKKNEKEKKENGFPEIKGLSAHCELLLGSPLDKTEQCSVWDRRPLRDLQTRYAALDAYVMLMMFNKCVEWASRLGLNIDELCTNQPPITTQLPLFFGSAEM